MIGSIERVDQITGQLAKIEVAVFDVDRVMRTAHAWRPDPTAGSKHGSMFNWASVTGYWPERSVLGATLDGVSLAMMQIDDDYAPLRYRQTEMRAVYVPFLEVAPWLRTGSWQRRFVGVGAAMLCFAVNRSKQLGYSGRIALHSVVQARDFYAKIGFREAAEPGMNEFWEPYLELSPGAADNFLAHL